MLNSTADPLTREKDDPTDASMAPTYRLMMSIRGLSSVANCLIEPISGLPRYIQRDVEQALAPVIREDLGKRLNDIKKQIDELDQAILESMF